MLHIDLVILTDWLLDGSSVAGAGGGVCGGDMNVNNHDPGNMKTLISSKTLSKWVLIRSLGNCIEHIRWDHWRLKYTEVQSQQMAFTRSPSLSNNPKILNNYLIFTENNTSNVKKPPQTSVSSQPWANNRNGIPDLKLSIKFPPIIWLLDRGRLGVGGTETYGDLVGPFQTFSSSLSIKFPPTFLILGRGRLGVGGTEIDGDRHWPLSLETLYDKIPPLILICKYSGHVFKYYIICTVEMLALGYQIPAFFFLKNEAALTPYPISWTMPKYLLLR